MVSTKQIVSTGKGEKQQGRWRGKGQGGGVRDFSKELPCIHFQQQIWEAGHCHGEQGREVETEIKYQSGYSRGGGGRRKSSSRESGQILCVGQTSYPWPIREKGWLDHDRALPRLCGHVQEGGRHGVVRGYLLVLFSAKENEENF